MTNSESIINAATEAHNELLGIKPVLKTFVVTIELQGHRKEWKVKAETLSQAESNLMKFLRVKSATFPGSREIFK